MRTIIYIAFTILVFSSCGRNYADYDFGEFEFKDPFCGIEEEYRPEFLIKTLEYPPFSWFMEDSTYNEAFLFHVEFNEECVRDKSPVEFCITDKDGNVINCLSIECEGKVTHNGFFYVYPNSKEKDIQILVNAPFEIGDTTFVGTIAVNRYTVDEVNEVELSNSYESIGSFYFKHEISWNWPIVIMWLLCVLFVGYLIFLILKGLFLISCQIPVKISFNKIRNSINSRKNKEEQMNDFRQEVKKRTGWSDDIVRFLHSREEAEIYIRAGLVERRIGGRAALVRNDIDWRAFNCRHKWLKRKLANWDKWKDYNNADLIGEGWPPRDSNGDPYELHHIGQRQDSPLAELTWPEHMGDGNNAILHPNRESVIDRQQFDSEKSRYWQDRYKAFTKEEIKRIYG